MLSQSLIMQKKNLLCEMLSAKSVIDAPKCSRNIGCCILRALATTTATTATITTKKLHEIPTLSHENFIPFFCHFFNPRKNSNIHLSFMIGLFFCHFIRNVFTSFLEGWANVEHESYIVHVMWLYACSFFMTEVFFGPLSCCKLYFGWH